MPEEPYDYEEIFEYEEYDDVPPESWEHLAYQ